MGSVYKRGKKWAANITVTKDGESSHEQQSGFATKTEAQKWAFEHEDKKSKNMLDKSSGLFIDEFRSWYSVFKEPIIEYKTKNWYEAVYKHLKEAWPNKKLKSVKAKDLQMVMNDYGLDHVMSSAVRFKSIVAEFVRYAVDEDFIRKDFTRNIKLTARKESKPAELKFIDIKDMNNLVESCKTQDDESSKMILMASYTGMRYAEVAGLTPEDINLEDGSIDVNKNWDMKGKTFKKTKTPSSVREISIPLDFVEIIKKWDLNRNFLFQGRNGFPPSDNACNKKLKHLLEKNNSEKIITMHGLRHSHTSYLLSNDVSIYYISERLGHANINITLRVYSHLLKDKRLSEDEKALGILANL